MLIIEITKLNTLITGYVGLRCLNSILHMAKCQKIAECLQALLIHPNKEDNVNELLQETE